MRHQIRYFVVGLFLASAVLTFSGANKAQEVNANALTLCIPTKDEIIENGYPRNELGETYGIDIKELNLIPDLLLVYNGDGVCGYIRISEMECHLPGSPDDVENYTPIGTMNMYTEDGSTIVGTFNFN